MAFNLNVDSINDPKNQFNHYVGKSIKGFHRITFDPFIWVRVSI